MLYSPKTNMPFGEPALESIEFRNCSPQVRSVIELVIDYSLGGFAEKRARLTPHSSLTRRPGGGPALPRLVFRSYHVPQLGHAELAA